MTVGVELWNMEWAHEQALKALEWLAKNYPECSGAEGLRERDKATDEAGPPETAKRTSNPCAPIAGPVETRR
jgi:hypothetical protein